jgi:hypothetical protein
MGERQIIVPFAELDQVQVICKKCGAGVIADAKTAGCRISNGCPGCGESFAFAGRAIAKYREFFADAQSAEGRILFRIIDKD